MRVAKRSRRDLVRRCADVSLCVCSALVIFINPVATVSCLGQSQSEQKPTTSAATKPDQKPGARENPSPKPASGTIKGRVVSDDGRPITNAIIMAGRYTGVTVTKPSPRVDEAESLPSMIYQQLPTF
jgi:hypothetical protein